MTGLTDYTGKKLALILMGTDANGDDEWTVFFGTATYASGSLHLDRGSKGPPFEIREEWLPRIKAVDESLKSTLNDADFMLSLAVGNLPADADTSDYLPTGLKVPPE